MAATAIQSGKTTLESLFGLDKLFGRSKENPFSSFGATAAAKKVADGLVSADRSVTASANASAAHEMSARTAGIESSIGSPGIMQFLKDNMLSFGRRIHADGRSSTRLVDNVRGNDAAVGRVAGSKIAKGKLDKASKEAAVAKPLHKFEIQNGIQYRSRLTEHLRAAKRDDRLMFDSWDDVAFSFDTFLNSKNDTHDKAYLVRKGVGYIGDTVGTIPNVNNPRAYITRLQKELSAEAGRPVKVICHQGLVPGTPILLQNKNFVRATSVDQSLDAALMTRTFGETFTKRLEGQKPVAAPGMDNPETDKAAFLAKFAAKKDEPAQKAPSVLTLAKMEGLKGEKRIAIQQDPGSPLMAIDVLTGEPINKGLHEIPKGEYPMENGFGMPEGTVTIGSDGSATVHNKDGVEHNDSGPSFIPAPGTSGKPRWAQGGQTFNSEAEKRAFTVQAKQQAAEPVDTAPAMENSNSLRPTPGSP